jgi:hypothetical protein
MIARKWGAAVAATAAGFALLMAPQAATAAPHQAQEAGVQSVDCFVDVDRANYREAPNGRILGTVGRGQGFRADDWANGWYVGELWGDPQHRSVWMHYSVLNAPCGD